MAGKPHPWTPQLSGRSGPLYLAIAEALAEDLEAGHLTAGERLPTQRSLALALDVDLTTISRAFTEARRRGLIEATVGRGTFVRAAAPTNDGARPPIDMTMNLPPQPADAALRERARDGLGVVLARGDFLTLLAYRESTGAQDAQSAGALWLRSRLGAIPTERVLITSGAQAALHAAASSLANPGDLVLTEALTYPGFRAVASHLGLRLMGLPIDAEGLLPDALDAACRAERPKLLYCVPTLHNPTTATMSERRRRDIATIARRHALPIVEDDPYGLLARQAPPPIAAFAPAITIYVSSLAKVIAPALRIAYVVVPDAQWAARLMVALRATELMGPPLMVALATSWIVDGTAAHILSALRKESMARQRIARALLPAEAVRTQPEAHHLWLMLPARWLRSEFADHLRRHGLVVVQSDAFTVSDKPAEAVRLSLGAAPDQEALRHALAMLAESLRQRPEAVSPVV